MTPRHEPPKSELTWLALGLGLLLAVVMSAANVYLGLRVGMTVSAAIPAAVLSLALLQGVLRRRSILESNLVQTAASSGESLAAGVIFTIPALLLAGVWREFDLLTTALISLAGGLLGTLLMIPMRRVFVVGSPELKFPEGVACAEVLKTGQQEGRVEEARAGARLVFRGLAVGALFKLCASKATGLLPEKVEWAAFFRPTRVAYYSIDISPALLAVGVIVGLPVASQIFLGGTIGWFITLPLLQTPPVAEPTAEAAVAAADALWNGHIRYLGVGAMVVGGLAALWRVRGSLGVAVREMFAALAGRRAATATATDERDRDLAGRTIVWLSAACVAAVAAIYFQLLGHAVWITLVATVVVVVMAFFLTAIASYIVGLVGSSNSPVSGMTIMALLTIGALVYLLGYQGDAAKLATLGVAGVACCVACTAGDICNDLKTGYLVGASPRRQQIVQVASVAVAAFTIAPVLSLLHAGSLEEGTGGIGGETLSAPQARLFATLVEGFFGKGEIQWGMVAIGVALGAALLAADAVLRRAGSAFRLHVMPIAVGIYLPLGVATPILVGGLLHWLLSRRVRAGGDPLGRAVLLASGAIAGESLVGVGLGILAAAGGIVLPGTVVAVLALAIVAAWIVLSAWRGRPGAAPPAANSGADKSP